MEDRAGRGRKWERRGREGEREERSGVMTVFGLKAQADGMVLPWRLQCRRIRFKDGEKNNSGCCFFLRGEMLKGKYLFININNTYLSKPKKYQRTYNEKLASCSKSNPSKETSYFWKFISIILNVYASSSWLFNFTSFYWYPQVKDQDIAILKILSSLFFLLPMFNSSVINF